MAATYTVKYATGSDGSPTWNALPGSGGTAFRFKTNTDVAVNLSDPIPIPSSGFNYSYWVSLTLDLGGSFTQVDNIRHYCDGGIGWATGTGGGLFINTNPTGLADADYDQSQGTSGTTGDECAANHGGVTTMSSIASYTSGSPLTVDSTAYTSTGNTKHIVLQVKVADDATQGVQSSETLTWLADEI